MKKISLCLLLIPVTLLVGMSSETNIKYEITGEIGLAEVPYEVTFNHPDTRIGSYEHLWKISLTESDTYMVFSADLRWKKLPDSLFIADPLDSCNAKLWAIKSVINEDTNLINWEVDCSELKIERTDSSLIFNGEIIYNGDINNLTASSITICGYCEPFMDYIEPVNPGGVNVELQKPGVMQRDSVGDGPDPAHDITFFWWNIEKK